MKHLCRLVAETLRVEPGRVDPQSGPLTLSEWDSFNHLHLVATIEENYNVELSLDEIATLFSVSDIARCLGDKGVLVD